MALVTKGFKDILSFSRNSEKTYFDKDGVLQKAGANEPAFTHDPVTGEPLGLSVHEQRTNLFLWSEDLTNTEWIAQRATVSAQASPYESNSSVYKVVPSTLNSNHYIANANLSVVTGVNYSITAYCKASGYDFLQVCFGSSAVVNDPYANFDLVSGIVNATSGIVSAKITKINNYYKINVVVNFVSSTPSIIFSSATNINDVRLPANTGDGTGGFLIWRPQLEQGSFPTPYMPTTTAQVTRQADVCSVDNIDQSDWWNPNEGTFVIEFKADDSFGYLFNAYGSNNSNESLRVRRHGSNGLLLITTSGGSLALNTVGTSEIPSGKLVVSFNRITGVVRASVNGSPTQTFSGLTIANFQTLALGAISDNNAVLNGHLDIFKYSPSISFTGTELQELSKL